MSLILTNTMPSNRQVTARMFGAVLALLAALIALYLLLTHLSIAPLVCPNTGCEKVQTSVYSEFLGIPVAAFGLAFYLFMVALQVAGLGSNRVLGIRIEGPLVALSVLGVLTYVVLTYLELFV
ncbi:MAG TPA: vitamin K epoxide reductase family protein, partial [Deinococcales bacterium]|nr:vitamin K epoxide reductase family protein [Deinococcales bacterium]